MPNDNPAFLNEADADPSVYTVDHGMTTKQIENPVKDDYDKDPDGGVYDGS